MTLHVFDVAKSVAEAGQQARTFANGYYFHCALDSNTLEMPVHNEHHTRLATEFAEWFAQKVIDYYLNGGNLPADIPTAFWKWTSSG